MKRINLVLSLILAMCLIGTNAYSADEWLKTRPAITDQKYDYPEAVTTNNEALDRLLSNYREGATLEYLSATTITITSGEVVCSNSAGSIRKFRKNPSSTTVTWADIDTGAEANSTTYYVYAVADADAETFTAIISASASAPTGATYYKRLGSFYNDDDGDIDQYKISNFETQSIYDSFGSLKVYDSGWFSVSVNTEYSKTHNLGTTKVIAVVYGATSSSGDDMATLQREAGEGSTGSIYGITDTICKFAFSGNDQVQTGATTSTTTTYARIIMQAFE